MSRKFLHSCPLDTWMTTPCTCMEGFSGWHTLALGLMPGDMARGFLASTLDAPGAVLLDDLFEHTTSPPWPGFWLMAGYGKHVLFFSSTLVGVSVEQLCRMQGLPLLGNYLHLGAREWAMHPVVRGFDQWIEGEVQR